MTDKNLLSTFVCFVCWRIIFVWQKYMKQVQGILFCLILLFLVKTHENEVDGKGKVNPLLKPGSFAVNPFSCHKSSILNKYWKWLHTLHSQQCQFSSKIGSISPFKMFASYTKNTLKHHEKYIQTCQINVITLSSRWIGYKWYMCFVSKAFN